ncbi:hypothetical protein [Cohnella sp. GCM10027633]|uniref:hypothetical protein n=1 Tax=unclassified Cohnella TaxID=2636738 RepID=UPI00363A285E
MAKAIKRVRKNVKKEILILADMALTSSAANIGRELVNLRHDIVLPSDLSLETVKNALMRGVIATGQEMMTKGFERAGISAQGLRPNG